MLIQRDRLKQLVLYVLTQRIEQGTDIDEPGFVHRVEAAADSYDALYNLARELRSSPIREDWPIRDYISREFLETLGRRHESWEQTTRGHIHCVAADDDIHYTIIGMRLLEDHGLNFSADAVYQQWSMNVPPGWTWGPERSALLAAGINRRHVHRRFDRFVPFSGQRPR